MGWAKKERNLLNILRLIIGFPRSVYFNFRCLPFKHAIKMPVILSHKTSFKCLTGKIVLTNPKSFALNIGFGTTQAVDFKYERTVIDLQGTWVAHGKVRVGAGSKISVLGELTTGNDFNITARTTIICNKKIQFGNKNLISWDNLFMDTDQHIIRDFDGRIINEDKSIILEDNVWVGCGCTIMKGSEVAKNSIIGAGTLLRGKFKKENVIIAGNPGVIVREGMTWD